MHNQKALVTLWHINLFFVILLKFWSNQLCLGLEWTNEISHEQEFLTKDLSWMELDYPKDYHPPEEFNLDSGKFTQPTGKKNPFSINGSPHKDLQSVDPEIWTMSREETSPQKKTQVQDLNQGKSKKRKGKTNAENSDEDVFRIMDMNVCAPRNQDSQDLFPQKKPSNSPFKVRKSYKSTSIFFLLQKVGICNANRSSTLCYKIYDYFHDIYESMSSRFKSNPKAVQAAAQAVKIAGHGVAMGVLGVIRVFEAEGSKGDHLDIVLDDGWRYIENFFQPWRDAELKELALEVDTPFEAHKSLDAYYLLGYLKRLDNTNKVPYLLVHSLALDWSRNRVNSGIPAKTLSAHIQRITDVYQTDSNAIQGGLYGRMSIRNYAFWGEEQLSRRNWYLYEHTQRSSQDVLSLSSNAAQFHTPVGRGMCQVVHNFFEDLINDLKRFYMITNGHSTVKDPPGEALRDLGMIIQAVSMAEYRVTVVFLGVIRILNQKHLDNSQLERLIINAWGFLKSRFSEWRFLDLYTKNSQQLFGFESVRVTSSTQMDSAGDLFKALAGFKDKNGCPKNWVVHLLKSWKNSITERDTSSLGDLGFPIAEIPSGPIDNWNLSPFGH
ncbi:hypothetical protein DFH28DRAFT_1053901 [Melampsora americana]|nr:hypothetical protein DFH28DRAFT_1053901 [Melampsora americana]